MTALSGRMGRGRERGIVGVKTGRVSRHKGAAGWVRAGRRAVFVESSELGIC